MRDEKIQKLKRCFFTVFQKRNAEIEINKEIILQDIYKKYSSNILSTSNDHLRQYSKTLSDFLSDQIKQLAICNFYNSGTTEEQKFNARKEAQSGNWFSSRIFIDLKRQLYLEAKLINPEHIIPVQILHTLHAYTGNGFYYLFDEATVVKLFEYAFDLFLVTGNGYWNSRTMNDVDSLISAVKHFGLKYSIDYEIENGKVLLTDNAHQKIHENIERLVRNIGGITVIRLLFERYLKTKFDKQIDRYLIHRNKSTLGSNVSLQPIPYQYITQIALKFLKIKVSTVLEMPLSTEQIDNAFSDLINDSRTYVNLLQVYNPSVMYDAMIEFESLPEYISNNIIFEVMCIPQQYSPNFIELLIKKLYLPKIKNAEGCFFLKSKNLPKLIRTILNYAPCSIITEDSLHKETNIRKSFIREFLAHFSQECNKVNAEFNSILERTNTHEYPLIHLGNGEYFFLSPHFSGYAFCERIYKTLKSIFGRVFDVILGEAVEALAKELLDEKGYCYKYGHYAIGVDNEQGECDLILETDKRILFIELKKRPLPEEFEMGDDVEVLKCLGEGMLTAQKQAFKHRLYLKKHGKISLYKNVDESIPFSELVGNGRMIDTISICLPEYCFFTTKTLASRIIESMYFVTYNAYDPEKRNRLDKLNKLSDEFRSLVDEYADGKKIDLHQLFFNVSFKSLQQFWTALNCSCSKEQFIENLICDTHLVLGSLDYYDHLKWTLSN